MCACGGVVWHHSRVLTPAIAPLPQVLRVFDAPASFVSALSNVPVASTAEAATTTTTAAAATGAGGGAGASAGAAADVGTAVDAVARVRRAYIPELGLSNKVGVCECNRGGSVTRC